MQSRQPFYTARRILASQPFGLGLRDHCFVSMKTPVALVPQLNEHGEFLRNKVVHPRCADILKGITK